MKTLVLGGYGNFGARICRALAGDPAIQLLIGGRDLQHASALARELGNGVQGMALDHTAAGFPQMLRDAGIELLIHTAGPFQQQDYAVARAAAAAGAHYIDLADGRRFVCDFPAAMNGLFSAAGRTAVCGASTVPALSSAVVDHLCSGWQRVDAIDTCIAPAQTAPRGRATLAGVLSYCGEALQVWDDGLWQARLGWADPTPVQFARLRPRLGALCDIPDLELFPAHYRVTRRVMFRAALELGLAQRGFAWLAGLRARGWVTQPARLAGLLDSTARRLDFLGTALGGMVVRVEGLDATGQQARRAWHIAADNNHGPEIPCMAAILLARKLAHADRLGGRAAMTLSGKDLQWLRLSIAFVWLATAAVSVWELQGQSAQLLLAAGVRDAALARWLILAGAGVDAVLGLALLLRPARWSYLAALAAMGLMTLVATVLDPSLWLHPLGPLTKNLPIAALLFILAKAKP